MKGMRNVVAGIVVATGLGIAALPAAAHPGGGMGAGGQGRGWSDQGQHGGMAQGMGPGARGGMGHGMGQGQHEGMGHGMAQGGRGGMGHGMGPGQQGGKGHGMGQGQQGGKGHGMGQGPGAGAGGQPLMSNEEREAFREKMRNAATPEERRQLAQAQRTEMQKRAGERGIAPHAPRGQRGAEAMLPPPTFSND